MRVFFLHTGSQILLHLLRHTRFTGNAGQNNENANPNKRNKGNGNKNQPTIKWFQVRPILGHDATSNACQLIDERVFCNHGGLALQPIDWLGSLAEEFMQVKSEIAGSVWKIIAETGADMAADDVIVILESMKMEIPVVAPKAGKLTQLHIAEGDMIAEGQLIATLE